MTISRRSRPAGYSDAQLVDISLAFATTVFTNVFNRINDIDIPTSSKPRKRLPIKNQRKGLRQ